MPPGGPDPDEARRRYDRMAPDYDCRLGLRSARVTRVVEALRKRAVLALQLSPGQTVIDAGCGTGDSFPRLRAAVAAEGRVVGVDQSGGMLEVAAGRIAAEGWTNVELIEARLESAPLPDAHAALLFFTHDLMRTPDAIARLVAALRPGGRVAAAGLQRPPRWPARLLFPAGLVARRYTTTREGLDRPWNLLAGRLESFASEPQVLGTLYLATGRRAAAERAI